MNSNLKHAQDLIDFIGKSQSPYHVVKNVKNILLENNFSELNFKNKWAIEKEGKYFVSQNDTSLFAFTVGTSDIASSGFKIVAAHSDSPTFKIKPSPEISVEDKYIKFNTETYGSPILNTWLDRPLSIAGRVSCKGKNSLNPITHLVTIEQPILIIPNLPIHFNRTVNEGIALNKQVDMLPVTALINKDLNKDLLLATKLSEIINVPIEDILEVDLNLYDVAKGSIIGLNNEFICSGKLDDLAMVHAGLSAILDSNNKNSTNVLAIFDNEEVGSRSKQGAGSPILKDVLNRILSIQGENEEDSQRAIYNSFMVSADMAHALHPNHPDKHDPVNRPIINAGPVIKIEGNQKYTTDSNSCAVFEMICKEASIPYQKFVNRSDMLGGGTLGNVSAGQLAISSVDVGNPMWAMHSIRETSGVDDHTYMTKALEGFYNAQ
ncbi:MULTISPECIES: M18 family aminopeptidase [Flavobacteriaceae]|uniref:M18 family aminopeptidase n=2 Tax=Flavobacteriaceae TaxID=49546 RepID=A0A4Y8AT45_9FLAO|nr:MULTISPECIES: M18 family aminopeptidase [Flavobacteriaceae]TEW75044.1 M18 family aminopeptidase [Gramella jeungdoensis]GGK42051.1 putative M18 family aminopeptidase 2 [Lutibacter litoralis]